MPLLDEGTSAAEAMIMMYNNRFKDQKSQNLDRFFVDSTYSQTLSVLKTRAYPLGIEIEIDEIDNISSDDCFGCIIQYPGKKGNLPNINEILSGIKNEDFKIVLAVDIMSLVIIEPPNPEKVDVVVGTTQRFGIPLGYGGPHAAFL